VLAVDWDLEAPGLHRYFYPFLVDKDITSSDGIINFVVEFKLKAMTPPPQTQKLDKNWYVSYANILRYAGALEWEFPRGGRLDFVPAGRQNQSYSDLVNSFDWQEFYEHLGGATFLEAARRHMKQNYEYILIDSRTGVSDTAGICTMQLPDDLVVCYTLNNQSIQGAAAVAAKATAVRGDTLRVFPVPMRVDPFEKDKLELRRQLAKEKFSDFPAHLSDAERESSYRATIQVPYIPYYAYEEILATFGDTVPPASGTLLESVERVTSYLVGPGLKASPIREAMRQRFLGEFKGGTPEPLIERAEEVLEGLSLDEQEAAKRTLTRLVRVAALQQHDEDKPVPFNLRDPDASTQRAVDRLLEAGVVVSRRDEIRFANDAVVRFWPRLREWIDDDRNFLLWRQDQWKIASDWSVVRDKHLLRRGSELKADEDWLRRRKGDLLPIEIEYIEVSRSRNKMRERFAQAVGLVVLVVLVLAINYGTADRRWKLEPLAAGDSTGVSGNKAMTPVSNGLLVVRDFEGTQIWDAKTGVILLTLQASSTLNSQGDHLLTFNRQDSSLAEVVNTSTQKSYKIHLNPGEQAFFDLSGRFVLAWTPTKYVSRIGTTSAARKMPAAQASTLQIWNVDDSQLAGVLKGAAFGAAAPYYVTTNGARLISTSSVWDIGTGSIVAELSGTTANAMNSGVSIAVDERQSRIATLFAASPGDASSLALWNLNTGVERLRGILPQALQSLDFSTISFSRDGAFLLLENDDDELGAVIDISDLRLAADCPNTGRTLMMGNRAYVVCSGDSANLALWDPGSSGLKVLKNFSVSTIKAGNSDVSVNADNSRLIAIRKTGQAELWNFSSGQKIGGNLDLSYKDAAGNQVPDSRAAAGNFTIDGSAASIRLEGGTIMLYAANMGTRIGALENAGGTGQEVYYDAACRQATVWTDTGRGLRYTEGKWLFNLFVPTHWFKVRKECP
jgi:WD40 repeat protein